MSTWTDWVQQTTGGDSSRAVGKRIGHSHTTALKWMHEPVSPEAVIALARAYNADVLRAFVAAGWLDQGDLQLSFEDAIKKVAMVKLTAELHRRAKALGAAVDEDVFSELRNHNGIS